MLNITQNANLGASTGLLTINKTASAQAVLHTIAPITLANNRPLTIGTGGGALDVAAGTTFTIAPLSTTAVTFNGPLAVQGGGTLTMNMAGAPQLVRGPR